MKSDATFTIYLSTVMCHGVESVKVALCHSGLNSRVLDGCYIHILYDTEKIPARKASD